VARATTADQRIVTGTLASIVADVALAGIDPPTVIVIGDVVGVGERLAAVSQRGEESAAALTS
jgi:siroheme synthase